MMKFVWQSFLCNRSDDSSDEEELKSSSSESTQSHSQETATLNGSHQVELTSSTSTTKHSRSNSNKENHVMANRFNMIESIQSCSNATDESIQQTEVSKLGDTIPLIGSDIARLISRMKIDGIQIINLEVSSSSDRDLLMEGSARFFEQVFHTFDLKDLYDSRRHLLTSFTNGSSTTESSSELLKKGIVLLLEDMCRACLTDKYLRKFKNALKFFSCLTQESISSFVIQLKSKLKVEYRGRARIFDGRMWIVEMNLNVDNGGNNHNSSPRLEITHRRTERLCQSDSRTKDLLHIVQTPRAAGSSIEEVCKFVWSITFSFFMQDSLNHHTENKDSTSSQQLYLDSPVKVDFEQVEQYNTPSVLLFLNADSEEEFSHDHQQQPSEQELNSQLVTHLKDFFKNSFKRSTNM
ncbi:hypothetical protein FDP41_002319 [Naegleria fowleri]|uniref:Uncharacterized protein n=1 Tax=Naegleria fowleri TaxID=5763 RepID=A0A6A5BZS0_NAEFO|nr:uncharacterized protein FDP41_002319 [Naegleria fowleri]KAF0978499.1 hypothetical protein FDP41_002319 [Naegleria fowleri]